jgi:hypothetical protein
VTRRPIDDLRDVVPGHVDVLVDKELLAWVRARDLVVGLTSVGADEVNARLDAAYDALDESGELHPHELWNVVLVVEVQDVDKERAARVCRRLARDLSRSRKLAFVRGDRLPTLFAALDRVQSVGAGWPDPISGVLDAIANGSTRASLDVLLRAKRGADEVEKLIEQLGKDEEDGA